MFKNLNAVWRSMPDGERIAMLVLVPSLLFLLPFVLAL